MKKRSRSLFVVSFLAPAAAMYGLFVVYPLFQAFRISLYNWRGVSKHITYAGASNFKDLFHDEVFWKALKNNLFLLGFAGISLIVMGIALAHGMQGAAKARRDRAAGSRLSPAGWDIAGLLRSVYLFPQVISMVVVAVLWQFLFNPSFGLIDSGLKAMHLPTPERGWLGDSALALPSVGIAFVWYALGFYIMLFSAGLNGIPAEVFEAAELDGAKGMRRFWTITWPLLWSVRRVAIVYVAINVMNIFALPFLMTRGGPDRATETLLTYLYEQGFQNFQFGYSTALAVANFVLVMGISLTLLFVFRRNPEGAKA